MISVDNLTVSFGGWDLFKDISLLVNPKDRIGLVGKNGAGKSTLLKVIAGEQPATSGTVTRSGDVTVGYLPQQMKVADTTSLVEETAGAFTEVIALEREIAELTEEIAVRTDYESADYEKLLHRLNDATDRYHILGGDNREAEIEKTLLGLGFRRSDFDRPTSEFSGGWRMRIELAKLLLRRPSVFLLDEPTNHLDIESIQWLEGYLKEYNGAVVLISHDRAFLDNVTNRTVEIMLGKLYDYKVPYSRYVELRRERRQQQMAAYENQQRMIEKTEEFIEKFRYKPTKSNQVQSRIKQLEKLDRIEVDEEDLSALSIKFPPAPRSGQIVAEVKGAGMSFGEKHVFSGAEFTIEKGDRIALVGRNGEGKTTFARMLVGELRPTEGSIRVGVNVNTGYYAQNQDDLMNGDFTVYDTLDRVAVGDIRTRLRDILGAFLFRGEDIDKKVKVLSGGERSRLAMARMMLEPHNLLVLDGADEPHGHAFEGYSEKCPAEIRRDAGGGITRPRVPRRTGGQGVRVSRRRGEGVSGRYLVFSGETPGGVDARDRGAAACGIGPGCGEAGEKEGGLPAEEGARTHHPQDAGGRGRCGAADNRSGGGSRRMGQTAGRPRRARDRPLRRKCVRGVQRSERAAGIRGA